MLYIIRGAHARTHTPATHTHKHTGRREITSVVVVIGGGMSRCTCRRAGGSTSTWGSPSRKIWSGEFISEDLFRKIILCAPPLPTHTHCIPQWPKWRMQWCVQCVSLTRWSVLCVSVCLSVCQGTSFWVGDTTKQPYQPTPIPLLNGSNDKHHLTTYRLAVSSFVCLPLLRLPQFGE